MNNIELETRLVKIEKQSSSRFFIQYLLSPLLVLIVGATINYKVSNEIEKAKSDIQRIDLAQKMIPIIFAGNPDQAFATQRLINKVVDTKTAIELEDIITKYYKAKIETDLNTGNIQSAIKTIEAAKAIGGQSAEQVIQSVKEDKEKDKVIKTYSIKFQKASQKEREGFEALIAGKYDDAIKAFQDSESIYNSYHQVYELARLINDHKQEMIDENKRNEIFKLIIDRYSYRAPQDLLDQLKETIIE